MNELPQNQELKILEESELEVLVRDGRVYITGYTSPGHIEHYVASIGNEIDYLTDERPADGIYTAHCRYMRLRTKGKEGAVDFIGAYNFTPVSSSSIIYLNAGDNLVLNSSDSKRNYKETVEE